MSVLSRLLPTCNVLAHHPELYENGSPFLLQVENTLFWVDRAVFADVSVTWNELFEREEPYPMDGVGTEKKPAVVSCAGALTAKTFRCFVRWMRYGARKEYSNEDLLDLMSAADYWVSVPAQEFVYDKFEDTGVPALFLLNLACMNNGDEFIRRYVTMAFSEGEASDGVEMVDQRISLQILRGKVRITQLKMSLAGTPLRIPMHYTCSDHEVCKVLWQKDWNFLIAEPLFRTEKPIRLRDVSQIMKDRTMVPYNNCRRLALELLEGRKAVFLAEDQVIEDVIRILAHTFNLSVPVVA